ncbi:MAG: hypothetical protein CM1200mP9_10900 [Gammaproteobacteria bacterium]|nr:MAG: hypothetical protein CM1200mP9_10900 [Gammaproteobacteria bacterium]
MQELRQIFYDCDADTILVKVEQWVVPRATRVTKVVFFAKSNPDTGLETVIADRVFYQKKGFRVSMANVLKLGVPSGSLQEPTAELFRRAGTNYVFHAIVLSDRGRPPNRLFWGVHRRWLVREQGVLDAGITGHDLGFSKPMPMSPKYASSFIQKSVVDRHAGCSVFRRTRPLKRSLICRENGLRRRWLISPETTWRTTASRPTSNFHGEQPKSSPRNLRVRLSKYGNG